MVYLTCEEVAEIAKCSIYCVREAVKAGKLKAYKPGRVYLFAKEDVLAWIEGCEVHRRSK